MASLSAEQAEQLLYHWPFWARPNQLPPTDDKWTVWLLLAGRGFGKTRVGAEWAIETARVCAGARFALVARTAADTRDTVVEGESGILARSPPWFRPKYEPSKRRLTWPNGSRATLFSADEPDLLRGPQHHFAWCDELAAWRYPEAWDQLMFGLRLGDRPRAVVTTTPRPVKIIRDLLKDPTTRPVRGSTRENFANLPAARITQLELKYAGTTLGRQELDAELLDEMPGALWKRTMFDAEGFRHANTPKLIRIVVAVDPATTAKEDSDETGIVVCAAGEKGQFYVLDDLSCRARPDQWARRAVEAYHKWKADRILAETNQGGDMVEAVIRTVDKNAAFMGVHAAKGKRARAEPIAALYEQGRVHHVGLFHDLEDQLCNYVPGVDAESPDRLDALVWGMTDLSESTPISGMKFDLDTNWLGDSPWRP